MASKLEVRKWQRLHKWSSLICTAFVLLACVTGLPLVFSDQIEDWGKVSVQTSNAAVGSPRVSLDSVVAKAMRMFPGEAVRSIVPDDEGPAVRIWLAPAQSNASDDHFVQFNAQTGKLLGLANANDRVLLFIRRLHVELFSGLTGELFMGAMGVLFVIAIVSGVVLYGPFTRKLDFGAVRTARTRRVRWLDLHNLLGVVTLAWALVVGLTGVMNELSAPLFAVWRGTNVAGIISHYDGQSSVSPANIIPVQKALDSAQIALPDMKLLSIIYPGQQGSTPYHYVLWFKGNSPLRSRLFSPVLIDARTGKLTAVVRMPWYLRALEVSRPLHFGDYGGLPLKILWALLDLVTIVVLGSGLYLWIARPRRERAATAREVLHGASPAMEPAE